MTFWILYIKATTYLRLMINKKVVIFKQFQGSHGVVLELFLREKSHAPTILINNVSYA